MCSAALWYEGSPCTEYSSVSKISLADSKIEHLSLIMSMFSSILVFHSFSHYFLEIRLGLFPSDYLIYH